MKRQLGLGWEVEWPSTPSKSIFVSAHTSSLMAAITSLSYFNTHGESAYHRPHLLVWWVSLNTTAPILYSKVSQFKYYCPLTSLHVVSQFKYYCPQILSSFSSCPCGANPPRIIVQYLRIWTKNWVHSTQTVAVRGDLVVIELFPTTPITINVGCRIPISTTPILRVITHVFNKDTLLRIHYHFSYITFT